MLTSYVWWQFLLHFLLIIYYHKEFMYQKQSGHWELHIIKHVLNHVFVTCQIKENYSHKDWSQISNNNYKSHVNYDIIGKEISNFVLSWCRSDGKVRYIKIEQPCIICIKMKTNKLWWNEIIDFSFLLLLTFGNIFTGKRI